MRHRWLCRIFGHEYRLPELGINRLEADGKILPVVCKRCKIILAMKATYDPKGWRWKYEEV